MAGAPLPLLRPPPSSPDASATPPRAKSTQTICPQGPVETLKMLGRGVVLAQKGAVPAEVPQGCEQEFESAVATGPQAPPSINLWEPWHPDWALPVLVHTRVRGRCWPRIPPEAAGLGLGVTRPDPAEAHMLGVPHTTHSRRITQPRSEAAGNTMSRQGPASWAQQGGGSRVLPVGGSDSDLSPVTPRASTVGTRCRPSPQWLPPQNGNKQHPAHWVQSPSSVDPKTSQGECQALTG